MTGETSDLVDVEFLVGFTTREGIFPKRFAPGDRIAVPREQAERMAALNHVKILNPRPA